MIKKVGEFFSEANGQGSSVRLVFIGGSFLIFITWMITCIMHKAFQPFDGTHVTMVSALAAIKTGQKLMEEKTPTP